MKNDEWMDQIEKDFAPFFTPSPRCGWYVAEGWRVLFRELLEDLKFVDASLNIDQVKEKFGGLRFYYTYPSGIDPLKHRVISALVRNAEFRASRTCERCGNYGRERNKGWTRVLCSECFEAKVQE